LLFLDHVGGGIHRLVPDDRTRHNPDFPTRLSKTGLDAPGVYPYSVKASPWHDGATAERVVAIPGTESVRLDGNRPLFPKDAVLAKTLSLGGRKVETQVLHFDGKDWQAYTYAWDEEQKDATLVGPRGAERTIGGQRWTYLPRATCMGCHGVSWVRHLQGFNEAQLGESAKRLRALRILPEKGFVGGGPDDPRALDDAARAYLHVNCAVCHRPGGGGTSTMDLRAHKAPKDLNALNVRPSFGDFGIKDAYLVAGGDPSRSTLYYRMAKTGHGRMPYVGSSVVDREGLELIARWIESLPPAPGEKSKEPGLESTSGALALVRAIDAGRAPEPDLLDRAMKAPDAIRGLFERFVPPERRPKRLGPKPDPTEVLALKGDPERGRALFFESASLPCRNCHIVGGRGENYGPDLSKIGAKSTRAALLETILQPSKQIDPQFATWAVQADDGAVHTGLLVEKTDQVVVLKDAARKEVRLKASSVARMLAQQTSAMPEFLLQDLTAAEAADLLDFLASLK
jgi:putative heme-binding domain-containing protein